MSKPSGSSIQHTGPATKCLIKSVTSLFRSSSLDSGHLTNSKARESHGDLSARSRVVWWRIAHASWNTVSGRQVCPMLFKQSGLFGSTGWNWLLPSVEGKASKASTKSTSQETGLTSDTHSLADGQLNLRLLGTSSSAMVLIVECFCNELGVSPETLLEVSGVSHVVSTWNPMQPVFSSRDSSVSSCERMARVGVTCVLDGTRIQGTFKREHVKQGSSELHLDFLYRHVWHATRVRWAPLRSA